jgi:hypothetical protein
VGIALAQLRSSTDRPNGEEYQSPWLEGEECRSLVKNYTTTPPQYTHTLPLEGGIAVAQLRSSTDRPNGEKYQSPWRKGEGLSSIVKTHTATSLQYTHTLPHEEGIALAQLHSSTNGSNGEKRPRSIAQGKRVE